MVDIPQRIGTSSLTTADWLNENVRDQLRAQTLHKATAADQIFYGTGVRELAALDAPSGMTTPVLVGGATPEWQQSGSIGGESDTWTRTSLFDGNVEFAELGKWKLIVPEVVVPIADLWEIVWIDGVNERWSRVISTSAIRFVEESGVDGGNITQSGHREPAAFDFSEASQLAFSRTSGAALLIGIESSGTLTNAPMPLRIYNLTP